MGNITWSGNNRGAVSRLDPPAVETRQQRGAALLEFAIILPLLVMLIVGIIESGWIFAQYLDVRHGAREGARIAAVNYPEGSEPPMMNRTTANRDALVDETCSRMSVASTITVSFDSAGGPADPITVTVTAPADTLSGLLDWAFPSSLSVHSTTILHSEQQATWANTDPAGQAC